ncbi:phosphoglucosamine mutase [Hugenholtzia roseola]|uniref:phosphoglucosamine mutase n=1 Tax=Hugenholtzia roseola TaxID=1002 RepID=UPI00047A62BF|nr:phosphoglucosamine mutase [Hugenholtzia roseola]
MTLIKSISGIRGTIGGKAGETLSPEDVVKFSAAFGTWAKLRANMQEGSPAAPPRMVIGRDARLSGEMYSQLVAVTLRSLGIEVIDLGLATTPTVEMAVPYHQAIGGIILTASHNPSNWNALKLLNQEGEFISADEGAAVLEIADQNQIQYAKVTAFGGYQEDEKALERHVEAILALPAIDREAIAAKQFRIVVDGCNSVGGFAVPYLLERLGVETIERVFCEPTGVFERNPEPLPENITYICSRIRSGNFHLGIVVDPDVDRLCLVCEDGTPFGEEYTLVAVADYLLQKKSGNTVSNLSSTRALAEVTEKAGGTYFASAVGEVNVVASMKANQALIGGEGNGGVIYPELHYGRDALVGIALFLSHLAHFKGSANMLKARYPDYHISKNKIELDEAMNVAEILEKIAEKYKQQQLITLDGVKIIFESGEWVHLRPSNTEPIIRIYAESSSESTAEHLARKIMIDIKEIIAF